MTAPSEARRAASRAWYARNRDRHIANVQARRKSPTYRKFEPGEPLVGLDPRIGYAMRCIQNHHPALYERERDDCRQIAALAAITAREGRLDLARMAGRLAYRLEAELGMHDLRGFHVSPSGCRSVQHTTETRWIERIDNARNLLDR